MRLNLASHTFNKNTGYGRYANYLVAALLNEGVDVMPVSTEILDAPAKTLCAAGIDGGTPTLYSSQPNFVRALPGPVGLATMYEDAEKLPDGWPLIINTRCDFLIVPCEQNAELFKKNGVGIPIHVVHGGTSPTDFPLRGSVKRNGTFTFACLGDRFPRKGTPIVQTAFETRFPADKYPNHRLVIKTLTAGMMNGIPVTFEDKRISVWREDSGSLYDLFEIADCFVFPSYGEGWGMPPREAAMAGVPTIVPRNTGLEPGIDCWATRVIEKHHLQKSLLKAVDGMWHVPDAEETAEAMMWVYENHTAALTIADAGAQWLRENQTWQHTARALLKVLEKYT